MLPAFLSTWAAAVLVGAQFASHGVLLADLIIAAIALVAALVRGRWAWMRYLSLACGAWFVLAPLWRAPHLAGGMIAIDVIAGLVLCIGSLASSSNLRADVQQGPIEQAPY